MNSNITNASIKQGWDILQSMKINFKSILKFHNVLLSIIVAILVIALFIVGALGYLEPLEEALTSDALTFGVGNFKISLFSLIKGLITLIILYGVASFISRTGEKYIKRIRNLDASNRSLLIKAFQISIYFILFLLALEILGVDFKTIALLGGAVGIGLGFGLQKITSNFISGLILLFEKSVEEDDLVELDGNITGFVRDINARYTLVETFENREIMIPNEDFITSRVTNWTFSNMIGRVDVNVGVSYKSDLDLVRKIMLDSAKTHPKCCQAPDPEPECYLVEFGDSSVNFVLYFWVNDIIEGRVKPRSDVLFTIWNSFKEHGIEIPFPQRDVHVKQMPETQ